MAWAKAQAPAFCAIRIVAWKIHLRCVQIPNQVGRRGAMPQFGRRWWRMGYGVGGGGGQRFGAIRNGLPPHELFLARLAAHCVFALRGAYVAGVLRGRKRSVGAQP